jgi:hypothetical protein
MGDDDGSERVVEAVEAVEGEAEEGTAEGEGGGGGSTLTTTSG